MEADGSAKGPNPKLIEGGLNQLMQGNLLASALNFGAYFVTAQAANNPVVDVKPVQPVPKRLDKHEGNVGP